MAKLTIYMPDDLAADAKAAELNISRLAQDAVAAALREAKARTWLERVRELPRSRVSSADVDAALRQVREEWGA